MKKILAVALTAGAAILLGAVIGGLSGGFLWLIDLIQKALWENSLAQVWYAPLVICTLGGLLVGLCQRYLGNHPKSINEAVQELAQSGRLAYRHLPQGLVTVGVSLSAGASLGPEAAIIFADDGAAQSALAEALSRGPVHSFGPIVRPLSDYYREVTR